jgi:hypothetical protein
LDIGFAADARLAAPVGDFYVSRKRMRLPFPIVLFALTILLIGCATSHQSLDGMVGTWSWSYSLYDTRMLVRLDANGQWAWRPSDVASNSEAPTQSGRWFVHDSILVLRIEKSASDKLPAGLAFTSDLRKALPDRLILFDPQMKREIIWTRTANKVGREISESLGGR